MTQMCESCGEREPTRETIGGLLCDPCRAQIERYPGNECECTTDGRGYLLQCNLCRSRNKKASSQ